MTDNVRSVMSQINAPSSLMDDPTMAKGQVPFLLRRLAHDLARAPLPAGTRIDWTTLLVTARARVNGGVIFTITGDIVDREPVSAGTR